MAFLDTFDRADGPIGAPWSVDVGSFAVTSSEAAYTGAYTYPVDTEWSDFPTHIERTATVDVGSANMVCEWDFSRNSTLYMACIFRYVSPGPLAPRRYRWVVLALGRQPAISAVRQH